MKDPKYYILSFLLCIQWKYTWLYTFASDRSYAAVLTQKNSENNEVPIAFMSSAFKGAELNYPAVDRQAYAVFKAVTCIFIGYKEGMKG